MGIYLGATALGGGGEGAGISSYAPFKVTSTNNPQGYNATTGLYTNPVDESVWLKTGKQVVDSTTPRTYPNATTTLDMFIPEGVTARLATASPYNSNQGLLWRLLSGNDAIFNSNSGSVKQFSYNTTTKAYTNTFSYGTHSSLSYSAWNELVVHEASGRWYDRGTPTGYMAVMPSTSNGGPDTSSITYYDMISEMGSGYYPLPKVIIGNFLYVSNQSQDRLWKYSLNPTTGAITGYTGDTWNITTALGVGGMGYGIKYNPIDGYLWFKGVAANTQMMQVDQSTMTATGAIYDTIANTATNGLTDVSRFNFGKIGSTNVLFIQGTIYQQLVGQFYSEPSDFIKKVGDITVRTDASGSAQPLFIKLK